MQEYLQGKHFALPTYEVIKIEGEAHCQTFTVECTVKNVPNINRTFIAKGSSRRKAEQAVAEQILKHWKLNDRIKSRTRDLLWLYRYRGSPKCREIYPIK